MLLLFLILVVWAGWDVDKCFAAAEISPPNGRVFGDERSELPDIRDDEDLSSLEGWERVELYWLQLEKEVEDFVPSWSLGDVWKIERDGLLPRPGELISGLIRYLFAEVLANLSLMGQLLLLAVVASLLKNLQRAFGGEDISRVSEAVIFFVMLGLALGSFTLAVEIGREAVNTMENLMLALLPVLLTLVASMGHVASASLFHPLIIFSVNLMASLVRNIVFPLIYFATILYLVSHFSPNFKIGRLADLFKEIALWGLGLMLTLFIGLTAIQGVAGGVGDAVSLRTARFMAGTFIPVVGKMLSDAVETVLGYSLLLKNSATLAGLVLLALTVIFPLLKILALVLIYRCSGALIQPLGETDLGEALHTMANCLLLIFAAVATVALAFFIGVAIIVGASNAIVMLR